MAEAIAMLTGMGKGDAIAAAKALPRARTALVQHTGTLQLPGPLGPLQAPHRAYLAGRGWDPDELARLWGLQALGIDGRAPNGLRLPWRIFIPLYHDGKVVSWTTRTIGDRNAKRWFSAGEEEEAIPHKKILFGEDYCRAAVVAVEGPTDVFSVGPGAVCTFGTAYTEAQIRALARYPVRAICFDKEKQAQAQAEAVCAALSVFPGTTYNIVLDSKDPGCATDAEIRHIRQQFLE